MQKEVPIVLCVITLLFSLLVAAFSGTASAWSNGGYHGQTNPGYGTHDWIAQHALDYLPTQEKQLFVSDNLTSYLYGTELPDNRNTPDGVGDTTKHHIYFFANGTLQDDAAAVRARDEYANAKMAYLAGNYSAAAEHLGMVAHYVADLAVFGHLMGTSTPWGTETHHSDYEDYVLARTETYTGTFTSYLVFDGSLTTTTAYDAAVAVARDTAFDHGDIYNCTWMNQHYNWSDTQFKTRMGESLSVATNAVADVMHTFYLETVTTTPEFPSSFMFAALLFIMLVAIICLRKKGF
jgi:hypothetical protein